MKKKILIVFFSFFVLFTIASCGKDKSNKSEKKKTGNLSVNIVDKIDFDDTEEQMQDIPIDNPNMFQCTYMDVDPDFIFTLESRGVLLSDLQLGNSVIATNPKGDEVELTFNYRNDSEKTLYDVRAKDGYEPGKAYTVSIPNNDTLVFEGKSSEIRKILFTVKEESKDNVKLKINYTNYDDSKIISFDGYKDPIEDTYLVYDDEIECNIGDIITFSDPNGDEFKDRIYIEVLDISINKGQTKIKYKCPDYTEIFDELDVHVDNEEIDVENSFVLNDIENILMQIKYSDTALMYCYAVADEYDFLPQIGDFIDSVSFDFSFKPTGNSFTLGAQASYTHTDSKGWRTVLQLKFEWEKSFVASGDAEIETFLGIPYDVSLNCSVATDQRYTAQFCITRKNKKFKDYNVEDTPKTLDMDKAREAVEDLQDRIVDADALGYKRDIVVGDTIMINIGYLGFHFGWFSIDIDVFVCLKFQTDITIGLKYTYSTHEVLVNYSTSSGNGDGGVSPANLSAKGLNFYICGDLSIEVFLKIRFSAYITGLKYIANIGCDVDAGLYFELSGLATGGWNFTTGEYDGNFGATIEAGIFFRVTLNVNLFWVIHFNWELYVVRFPMFKLGYKFDIRNRATNDPVELSQCETSIDNTNLLVFDALSGKSLAIVVKQYKYNEEITYFETASGKKNESYQLFKSITTDSNDVRIENGNIIVKEGIAETSGNIIVEAKISPFRTRKYTVPFYFKSKDAKNVTFNGQDSKSYLPGQKIEFPTSVESHTGEIFRGWALNGVQIDYKNGYVMGDENINFEAIYIEYKTYTVNFYDGLNNLVYTTHVNTLESVTEPDEATRDRFMEGYTFVCYDIEFDEVTSDLEIHAIYERSGE